MHIVKIIYSERVVIVLKKYVKHIKKTGAINYLKIESSSSS